MRVSPFALGLAVLAGAALEPGHAAACGGCFAPTGSPTVVTRHQMAVSLAPEATTLWDQIEYAGAPEDFVWVLPVRGGAPVELAENAFFEGLEQATALTLQGFFAPVRTSCADPCAGGVFFGGVTAAGRAEDGGPIEPPVTVHHQASIGPYETATIGSADPGALVGWLQDHGYAVPAAILPTIAYYVGQGMDFAVLRLAPGSGVNQMQPVRVTAPGMSPIFPLRMVAAGVDAQVGLELFVFAEGRYEAQNFANETIDRAAIAYDYATSGFTYDLLWDEASERNGGRTWITEYAGSEVLETVHFYSSTDEAGVEHSAAEDFERAVEHLPSPYLTRMTAQLPATALDEDLVLAASREGDLGTWVDVRVELNRPAEPTGCPTMCTTPYASPVGGDPGEVGWSGGSGDGLCSASPGREGRPAVALFALAAAGLALRRRRRR